MKFGHARRTFPGHWNFETPRSTRNIWNILNEHRIISKSDTNLHAPARNNMFFLLFFFLVFDWFSYAGSNFGRVGSSRRAKWTGTRLGGWVGEGVRVWLEWSVIVYKHEKRVSRWVVVFMGKAFKGNPTMTCFTSVFSLESCLFFFVLSPLKGWFWYRDSKYAWRRVA